MSDEMQEIPELADAPKHLAENHERRYLLIRSANGFAGLYGVPVYLVGSALYDFNDCPRDWDVRVMLPDEQFELRFGAVDKWKVEGATGMWTEVRWKWAGECTKRSYLMAHETRLNIDFQIYPESHAEALFRNMRKLRLDGAPITPSRYGESSLCDEGRGHRMVRDGDTNRYGCLRCRTTFAIDSFETYVAPKGSESFKNLPGLFPFAAPPESERPPPIVIDLPPIGVSIIA